MTAPGVRVAWARDADDLAALQLADWAERTAGQHVTLPDAVEVASAWRSSLTQPGDARLRVLVALDEDRIVGYAVVGPDPDPDAAPAHDAQLAELAVAPAARRRGHGSRLLHACVDTWTADGFDRATAWVDTGDEPRRRFLTAAGWQPDGAHRELADAGGATVRQVRLHTALT
ncbi:MAG TPA: GNAT family N-acetyltransferase [Nocardioides sp.]